MTQEQWKPIPNYPGYEVSDLGRIRSLKRKPVVIRNQFPESNGYMQLTLCTNGKAKNCKVAHLVLLAFVGPRPAGLEVCHNDNNKLNNRLDNLRYDTHQANIQDQWEVSNRHSPVSGKKIRLLREEYATGNISLSQLCRRYEVSMSMASLLVRGKRRLSVGGPIKGINY